MIFFQTFDRSEKQKDRKTKRKTEWLRKVTQKEKNTKGKKESVKTLMGNHHKF